MLMAIINTYKALEQLKRHFINNQIPLQKIILGIVVNENNVVDITFPTRQTPLFLVAKNLNHENLDNRLAVIYDLEEFSQNYPQYHQEIMGILSNFVQNYAADLNRNQFHSYPSPTIPRDIQLALTVIGRRNTDQDESDGLLDLSHTDMRGANLDQANLELTNLYQVNLSQANLCGANLSGAILSAANLSGANLTGANLSGAILSAANLSGANLAGANLEQANLYLANLQGATLGDAILKGANLREAKLG